MSHVAGHRELRDLFFDLIGRLVMPGQGHVERSSDVLDALEAAAELLRHFREADESEQLHDLRELAKLVIEHRVVDLNNVAISPNVVPLQNFFLDVRTADVFVRTAFQFFIHLLCVADHLLDFFIALVGHLSFPVLRWVLILCHLLVNATPVRILVCVRLKQVDFSRCFAAAATTAIIFRSRLLLFGHLVHFWQLRVVLHLDEALESRLKHVHFNVLTLSELKVVALQHHVTLLAQLEILLKVAEDVSERELEGEDVVAADRAPEVVDHDEHLLVQVAQPSHRPVQLHLHHGGLKARDKFFSVVELIGWDYGRVASFRQLPLVLLLLQLGGPFHECRKLVLITVLDMVLKYFVDRLRNDFLLLYQVGRLDIRIFLLNEGLDTVNKVGIEQVGATLFSNALQHGFDFLLSASFRLWIFLVFFSEGNLIKHDVHCHVISHDLVLVLLAVV